MGKAEDGEKASPNVVTSPAPESNSPPSSSAAVDLGPNTGAIARAGRGHRRNSSNRVPVSGFQQLQISDSASLSENPIRQSGGDQYSNWSSHTSNSVLPGVDPYGQYRYAPSQYPAMQWLPMHPGMGYGGYGDPRSGMYYDPRFQGMPFRPMGYPLPSPMQRPYPGSGSAISPQAEECWSNTVSGLSEQSMPVMPSSYQQLQPRLSSSRQRPLRSPKLSTELAQAYEFDVSEAKTDPESCRKTLMLRNIPNKYSIHMLLEMLDKAHRRSADEMVYDFCYLPIDFKNRCNLGYAFVNFTDSQSTLECYKTFHGKRWNDFNSKKVCEVKYGRVQGRDALIEHFKNSKFPNNDTDSLPLLFEQVENEDGTKVVRSVPLHSRQMPSPEDQ